MNFLEMYVEMESMTESETVSNTNDMAETIAVKDSEHVKMEEGDIVIGNGNEAVNVLEWKNLFSNDLDNKENKVKCLNLEDFAKCVAYDMIKYHFSCVVK